jgi:hypothetical protein
MFTVVMIFKRMKIFFFLEYLPDKQKRGWTVHEPSVSPRAVEVTLGPDQVLQVF